MKKYESPEIEVVKFLIRANRVTTSDFFLDDTADDLFDPQN